MKSRYIGFACTAIVLWSTLATLSLFLTRVPPFLCVGTTLTIGSILGIRHIRHWRIPRHIFLLGLYGLFGYHFFLFMALRISPPVEANLINYLWPLLIVVLSPVFLANHHLSFRQIVAAVVGFSGATLIVTGGHFAFSLSDSLGYLFAAVAAFIWSTYSLLCKRVSPFSSAAVGLFCLSSGILSLVCHFIFEPSYFPLPHEIGLLFLLGIGPMGLAFYLWDAALKEGDPRVIGSLAYLTPMLSTLILILSKKGSFTWLSIVAMILIVGGAALGSLPIGRRSTIE